MRGLNNKRFIVAGGANGIGAATAARLAAQGAKVLIGDSDQQALDRTVADLRKDGSVVDGRRFDLSDAASIEDLVRHGATIFGGLDGVAITAADLSKQTLGADVDVAGMDPVIWERTMRVNLTGHALMIRAILPHLKAAGGGSIVTTSSASAFAGWTEHPAYAASKSGLHALVRHTARLAGKDGIRCNGIAPGLVLTEGAKVNLTQQTHDAILETLPMSRLGLPEDLASAFAFFLSDEAAWITGQILSVNGGQVFRD